MYIWSQRGNSWQRVYTSRKWATTILNFCPGEDSNPRWMVRESLDYSTAPQRGKLCIIKLANKPWKILDFVCPWKNTLENLEITTYPWKIMFWSRFLTHKLLVLQCCYILYSCNALQEDLWGCCGAKTAYHLSCGKQPLFPTTETKFQVKRRMKGGWVQAEDLFVIIIFFENIVKNTLENPWNLAENPLENPGKEFHFTVGHSYYVLIYVYVFICSLCVKVG